MRTIWIVFIVLGMIGFAVGMVLWSGAPVDRLSRRYSIGLGLAAGGLGLAAMSLLLGSTEHNGGSR